MNKKLKNFLRKKYLATQDMWEVLKVLIWLKNMHWKFGWIYMEEEFAKRSRIKFIGIKKAELGWLLAH